MRGYIEQRSKGSYHLRVYVGRDPQTGKRRYQTETVRGNKRDAQKRLAELVTEVNHGVATAPSRTTVREYLLEWLNSYAKVNVAPRTYERYEEICRVHLIPALGTIRLTALQPAHIQSYYAKAQSEGRRDGKGGLSKQTVHHHHRLLYQALKHADRQGLVARNVAAVVIPPRPEHVEMKALDSDGLRRLLHASEATPYHTLFYTSAYTGLRRSEVLALRWERIDLELATLEVVESVHRLQTGEFVFRPPKSHRGRRRVALSPSVAILLREHRANQETIREQIGMPALQSNDLVFSHPDGSPISPDTISSAFRSAARKIGFAGGFHCLRHTHATLMLEQGVHPKVGSERLGHAMVSMTLDRYSHKVKGLDEAAALKFDEALERHRPAGLTAEGLRQPEFDGGAAQS